MDFEQKMEFLLDQQAKFFAGMEELRQQVGQLNNRADALTSDLMELAEFVHEFAAETRAGFAELRDIVARQSEQMLASFAEQRASNEMLSEQQSRLTQVLTTLVEQHVDLRGTVASLAGTVASLAADHKDLREEHKDLGAMVAALAEDHRLLAEASRHADERMNALIAVVDGVVRRLPPG